MAIAPDGCGCHPEGVADNVFVDQALTAGLVQPDPTTCGSCTLVMARMINDPSYAGFLVNGVNPASGASTPGTIQDRFKQQSLAMTGSPVGSRTAVVVGRSRGRAHWAPRRGRWLGR